MADLEAGQASTHVAASVVLRPYQQRAVDDIREAMRRHRRVLFQMATGGGKTVVFAYVASSAAQKRSRVLILTHRRELVRQTANRFRPFGMNPAIVGQTPDWQDIPLAIGMIGTCARRELPDYDLIITDEAHHAISATWTNVLDRLSRARVLGVTATPQRLDGRGLNDRFDIMVRGPSVRELTAEGYLAPIVAWAIESADVRGLRLVNDNWKTDDLDRVLQPFTERAFQEWCGRAKGLRTIAFCCSIRHAEFVATRWRQDGFRAACIHGKMDAQQRDRIIADFGAGKITLLTSCELIEEGFDVPETACVLQLRPTASITKHFQQIGRAMRPKADGSPAVVIDLTGNVEGTGRRKGLGLPDEVIEWTLDGKAKRQGIERCEAPARRDPEIEALVEGRMRLLRSRLTDCRCWSEAENLIERPEEYQVLQRYFEKPGGGRYRDVWIVRRCAERFFGHLPLHAALRRAGMALGKSRMVENSIGRGHGWTVPDRPQEARERRDLPVNSLTLGQCRVDLRSAVMGQRSEAPA